MPEGLVTRAGCGGSPAQRQSCCWEGPGPGRGAGHHSARPPCYCRHTQPSSLVVRLSLWGAGDSATGSMWQEVGTMTHKVAGHPPSQGLGEQLRSRPEGAPPARVSAPQCNKSEQGWSRGSGRSLPSLPASLRQGTVQVPPRNPTARPDELRQGALLALSSGLRLAGLGSSSRAPAHVWRPCVWSRQWSQTSPVRSLRGHTACVLPPRPHLSILPSPNPRGAAGAPPAGSL